MLEVNLGGVLDRRAGRRPRAAAAPRAARRAASSPSPRTAATRGLPMLAAYCAAKAGVAGFVRALAVELGGTGVTANAVSPGSTRTAILDETARLYGLDRPRRSPHQQPLGRLLEPEEVAALIAWLAGPQSRGATGGDYPRRRRPRPVRLDPRPARPPVRTAGGRSSRAAASSGSPTAAPRRCARCSRTRRRPRSDGSASACSTRASRTPARRRARSTRRS